MNYFTDMQIADSLTVDKKQTNNLSSEIWVIDERDLVVDASLSYRKTRIIFDYSLSDLTVLICVFGVCNCCCGNAHSR